MYINKNKSFLLIIMLLMGSGTLLYGMEGVAECLAGQNHGKRKRLDEGELRLLAIVSTGQLGDVWVTNRGVRRDEALPEDEGFFAAKRPCFDGSYDDAESEDESLQGANEEYEDDGLQSDEESGSSEYKRTHTGGKPFKCDFDGCVYASAQAVNLTTHKRTHAGEKSVKCGFNGCAYASTRAGDLKRHKRIHIGKKLLKCGFDGCAYASTRAGDLKRHKRIHIGKKLLKCGFDGCAYASMQAGRLIAHERTHIGEKAHSVRSYICNQCENKFESGSMLDLHKKEVHPIAKICQGDLTTHKRTHIGEKAHSVRPYICNQRENKFETGSMLDLHNKEAHPIAKIYQGDLTTHERTHIGEKAHSVRPYICNECENKFETGSMLDLHKKKVHPKKSTPLSGKRKRDDDSHVAVTRH